MTTPVEDRSVRAPEDQAPPLSLLLRQALEALPAWVMVLRDEELVIQEANSYCQKLFGGPVAGLRLPSLLPVGETSLVTQLRTVLRSGRPLVDKNLSVSLAIDGVAERRPWTFFMFPGGGQHSPTEVVLLGLDRTEASQERRRSELAAASRLAELAVDEQARAEAILRQVPVAVSLVDALTGELLFDSNFDHALRSHAFPNGLPNTDPAGSWLHPDGRPLTAEEWPVARCLRGETIDRQSLLLRRSDGGFRTLQVNGAPITSPHGDVTAAALVWDDVTLQLLATQRERAAQEELRSGRAILGIALGRAPYGVVIHQPGHSPVVNPRAAELLGFSPAVDHALLDADGKPLRPEEHPVRRALAGEQGSVHRGRLERADQAPITVEVHADVVRNAEGKVTHVVETLIEIADGANRTMSEAAAKTAHDLRSPISAILGWTRILARGGIPPEKQAHGIEVIERNARRQLQLIDDLFDAPEDRNPASPPPAPAPPAIRPAAEAPNPSSDLGGCTVLVVDDEADTRDLLRMVFQGTSARVVVASSGEDALKKVSQSAVDVVISDICMPTKDGFDLIHDLRQLSGDAMPAVAISGLLQDLAQERVLAAGYNAYLPKPIDPKHLVSVVAALFHHGPPGRA